MAQIIYIIFSYNSMVGLIRTIFYKVIKGVNVPNLITVWTDPSFIYIYIYIYYKFTKFIWYKRENTTQEFTLLFLPLVHPVVKPYKISLK